MDEQLEELRQLRTLLLQAREALLPYMQCMGHVCVNQEHQVYKPMYNEAARVVMAIDKESKI